MVPSPLVHCVVVPVHSVVVHCVVGARCGGMNVPNLYGFLGVLVLGGGKMRDAGNEVARLPRARPRRDPGARKEERGPLERGCRRWLPRVHLNDEVYTLFSLNFAIQKRNLILAKYPGQAKIKIVKSGAIIKDGDAGGPHVQKM